MGKSGTCLTHICRSPDISEAGARASMGGWGLGEGHVEAGRAGEEEEEDGLDWDQAQVRTLNDKTAQ